MLSSPFQLLATQRLFLVLVYVYIYSFNRSLLTFLVPVVGHNYIFESDNDNNVLQLLVILKRAVKNTV